MMIAFSFLGELFQRGEFAHVCICVLVTRVAALEWPRGIRA